MSSVNGCLRPAANARLAAEDIDGLAFGALWLLAFSIPAGEQLLIPGFGAATRLVGVCAFGLGLLAVTLSGRIRPAREAHYFLAAFALWSCATYFWTIAPEATAERAKTYLQAMSMVWLTWQLARDERRVNSLLHAYVMGTALCATVVFANYISGRTTTEEAIIYDAARYSVAGLNENDLGMLLALSIPMAWHLALAQRNRLLASFYWLQIAWAGGAIVLTGSRASVIAAGIGLLAAPLALRHAKRSVMLPLLGVGVMSIVLSVFFLPKSSWERISTIRSELSGGTMSKRTIIWQAAIEVFPERPLHGFGSGAFGQRIAGLMNTAVAAHNTFLSVLVESGLIGATLFLLLLTALVLSFAGSPFTSKLLWFTLLACWVAGVSTLSWEYKKATWFLFALASTHAAALNWRQRI